MMLKFIKSIILTIILFVFFLFSGCKKKKEINFSFHPLGYYHKLLSFGYDSSIYRPNSIAWVTASFKTQADSVFWDSFNNLNDCLFIPIDSTIKANFFKHSVSTSTHLDSVILLVKPKDFFSQQFGYDSIPFFSKNDSVVKINFKVKEVLSPQEFKKLRLNLQKVELDLIEDFFKLTKNIEMSADSLGFYWINKPKVSSLPTIEAGNLVTLSYQAQFLNGRFFDKLATNFEFVYGTPDQVLKGINIVIGKLKLGQTAKILLPSRLAFGENGSSNGIVAPYTPLIYEIKIIDVKKTK
jgi:FKBP-type peptidyl-prolyl cis-trans isomerase